MALIGKPPRKIGLQSSRRSARNLGRPTAGTIAPDATVRFRLYMLGLDIDRSGALGFKGDDRPHDQIDEKAQTARRHDDDAGDDAHDDEVEIAAIGNASAYAARVRIARPFQLPAGTHSASHPLEYIRIAVKRATRINRRAELANRNRNLLAPTARYATRAKPEYGVDACPARGNDIPPSRTRDPPAAQRRWPP